MELFANDSKLVAGLAKASAKLKAWGAGIATAGKGLLTAGLIDIGIAVASLKVFVDMGSALVDLSDQTGIEIEALQELGFAAEQSGSSMEELVKGIGKMQKVLAGAAGGSKEAQKALADLGLSIGDLAGLKPDEQFQAIADAIGEIDNPAQRTASAMAILGKAGATLIPTMLALAEERKKLRDSGAIISATDARAAEAFGDQLSFLWKQAKVAAFQVGSALLPAAKAVVGWLQHGATALLAWTKANTSGINFIVGRAVALVALGAGLIVLGKAFVFLGGVIGGVVTVFGVISSVLAFLVSPLGLVVVGLGALALLMGAMPSKLPDLNGGLSTSIGLFGELKETGMAAFQGIGDALAGGDWALAIEVMLAALKVAFRQFMSSVSADWRLFADSLTEVIGETGTEFRVWWAQARGMFGDMNATRREVMRLRGQDVQIRNHNQELRFQDAGGDARALAAALLELEGRRNEAIARAQMAADEREQEFGRQARPGGALDDIAKSSTSGTFSAAAVRGFAGAESPDARTARNTDEMRRLLAQLLNEARNGGIVFA